VSRCFSVLTKQHESHYLSSLHNSNFQPLLVPPNPQDPSVPKSLTKAKLSRSSHSPYINLYTTLSPILSSHPRTQIKTSFLLDSTFTRLCLSLHLVLIMWHFSPLIPHSFLSCQIWEYPGQILYILSSELAANSPHYVIHKTFLNISSSHICKIPHQNFTHCPSLCLR
jgi:hypothetical protein